MEGDGASGWHAGKEAGSCALGSDKSSYPQHAGRGGRTPVLLWPPFAVASAWDRLAKVGVPWRALM